MSITNVHTIYAANLGASFVPGVTSNPIDLGLDERALNADGSVDPTFAAVFQQAPRLPFTTSAIATALAAAGISGLALTSGAGAGVFFLQKMTDTGTREGTLAHLKMTVNSGLVIPVRLYGETDELATIDYDVVSRYDGTNAPIVLATSQTLVGSPSVAEAFTCGTFTFNGAEIDGVQSIEVLFNINLRILRAGGTVFPSFVGILSRTPIIRVRTVNSLAVNTLGTPGTAISSTAVAKFRKLAEGATRVADITAQHISITVNEGRAAVRTIPNQHGSETIQEIMVTPTYDGSNGILVISTTAAM